MYSTYSKMQFHLDRWVYKRGAHKGDAPLGKRWRTSVRVVKGNDNSMRVRMYGTDILTAYEDGRVVINTDGYWDRPTTKVRMNEALDFLPFYARLSSQKIFGMSQPNLYMGSSGKSRVLYYDGITLDNEGKILTPLKTFERKQVNKDESKELRSDMKSCGFTDVFTILHETCNEEDYGKYWAGRLRDIVTQECHTNDWVTVVAKFTFARVYDFDKKAWVYKKFPRKQSWSTLMNTLRKECYEVIATDVTHV
jgi:hypothetical protein